jgi:hypothetical protein
MRFPGPTERRFPRSTEMRPPGSTERRFPNPPGGFCLCSNHPMCLYKSCYPAGPLANS